MLKKLSIKSRLLFGFGLAITLSAIVVVMALVSLQNVRIRYDNLIEGSITTVEQIKEVRLDIANIARNVRDMCLNPDQSSYAEIQQAISESRNHMDSLREKIQNGYTAQDNYINQWFTLIDEWENEIDNIISVIQRGDRNLAATLIVDSCTPTLKTMSEKAALATSSMTAVRDEIQGQVFKYTIRINIFVVILLVLIVVILVFFGIAITHSIATPLDKMKQVMVAMSKGDFEQSCDYYSKDEFGVTADALRQSQKALSDVIQDLDQAFSHLSDGDFRSSELYVEFPGQLSDIKKSFGSLTMRMNAVMSQMIDLGNQVAAGAEQVAQGAQTLAQGATEQASSVEELSATIADISQASKCNAETANRARVLANAAGEAVEQSNQQMKEMLSAMDDIGSSSGEISKIIKTIEDIAFQTNILALNAAVEAARAGTAGKGFAVVADEVRNLASKSAEASQNTASLIEKSICAVERGSALAAETAAALNRAIGKVSEAVSNIDQITEAVGQEATSIQQTTGGIDQISAVVQTNSATSEQSAAAAEELSAQAQSMHGLLSHFRVKHLVGARVNGFDQPISKLSDFDHLSHADVQPTPTLVNDRHNAQKNTVITSNFPNSFDKY